MNHELISTLTAAGAVVLGGAIGLAFGSIQIAAFLRNRKLRQHQEWSMIPGSATRVAFLLVALVLVQIACPFFFEKNWMQWLVSGGVVIGYGWTLFSQVRFHSAHHI